MEKVSTINKKSLFLPNRFFSSLLFFTLSFVLSEFFICFSCREAVLETSAALALILCSCRDQSESSVLILQEDAHLSLQAADLP